jgi:hypothetical protein
MTEIALSFFIGFLIGLVMRPKDKDLQEQTEIYNRAYQKYEEEIQYYKDLCKWHVERKHNGQT